MKSLALVARIAALDVLEAILRRNRTLDDALEQVTTYAGLNPRDRAFARNLVSTTLRRLGQIDALIAHCLQTPLARKSLRSHDILRLGICQLLFLGTADHAAVSSSVDLAEHSGQAHTKKMINAVLRRIGRESAQLLAAQDESRANVPDWLWDSWRNSYGEETCRAIAAAHLQEAGLDLSVKSDPAIWAEKFEGSVLPNGTVRLTKNRNVPEMDGFEAGEWWVQDTAARAAVQMLGDVAGKRVIDLCAAPGGKTAFLVNAGAIVTAVDRSANRLLRLSENLQRLRLEAEVVTADATTWQPEQKADAVLLDAPCSATGTIRKHPEVSWLKSQADVDKLALLQSQLLDAAVQMVVPGGHLLYATCSLQPEEGPDQITRLTEKNPAIQILETLRCLPSDQPEIGGRDGFYVCLLQCP
ncbi:MAG: methyltransferase [Rhodospirillales bacterium]|nr:methyltransferase [Rhodospirillales bacterium]